MGSNLQNLISAQESHQEIALPFLLDNSDTIYNICHTDYFLCHNYLKLFQGLFHHNGAGGPILHKKVFVGLKNRTLIAINSPKIS